MAVLPPDVTDPLQSLLLDIRDILDSWVNRGLPANHVDATPVIIATGLEAVLDSCCPGLGWVRVVRAYPYTNFPNPAATNVGCPDTLFAADLELGIARCSAVPDETSGIIAIDDLDLDADQAGRDRSALFQAVLCDIAPSFECEINLGQWEPLANEGGCFGSTVSITIPYDMCCDPATS